MSKSTHSIQTSERIQEWAIINQHRALENRKMREMQKMAEYNKKMKFKQGLDEQLVSKAKLHSNQQNSDHAYLQYILKQAQLQKQREEEEKRLRVQKRKKIQQQNLRVLEHMKNSGPKYCGPEYSLDIGVKSEILQREKQKRGIKQMMDTLDLQIRQRKQEEERLKSIQLIQQNNSFVSNNSKMLVEPKSYLQDHNTYETYDNILRQKQKQEEYLYRKITVEPSLKRNHELEMRQIHQKNRKQRLTNEMMQTLDSQVETIHKRKQIQKRSNPEQNSFKFISDIFKEKPASYNKQKYYEQLRRQAEQQKERKKHQKFMNQQEYKINMNQLNKVVSGHFANEKYLDRSLDNIGALPLRQEPYQQYGKNSQIIRSQLQKLRHRQRSGFYSKMENHAN